MLTWGGIDIKVAKIRFLHRIFLKPNSDQWLSCAPLSSHSLVPLICDGVHNEAPQNVKSVGYSLIFTTLYFDFILIPGKFGSLQNTLKNCGMTF